MSDVAEESIAGGERERMREDDVDDEVSEDEEEDEETAGEEESRRESTAPSLSSLVSSPSTRGSEAARGKGGGARRQRPIRSHALVELTSLDELSLPTNAARSIKYTCIAASRRLLVLGTSTGSVYVFARFASKQRAAVSGGAGRLNTVPLHVYTTKDGALHTVRISPSEQLIAVGGESGRVSVLSLAAAAGGPGGAAGVGGATPPSSPASALIHTVPGDARKSDRVNCLCWSSDSSLLYAAHASGLVVQHKVGVRRSVFRSAFEHKLQLDGPVVQMEHATGTPTSSSAAAARLLISTPEATFVHDLQAGKAYQVGHKPRNSPMGACWMRGESGAAMDDFVLAARQNGRIWEASSTGIVYKTHQLRQAAVIPTLDPLSFRTPGDPLTSPPPPSFLQQAAIDTETARTTVHLGMLAPITVDSAPTPPLPPAHPPPPDALSLPSTSSATSSFASSTVSSSVSSTATVSPDAATRLVCSAVRSTLFVADIDRSQLIVVSDLGYVIRDWAVCGPDVFVLFAGSGGLRKYTLFPVEKAAERLLARKAVPQAARLILSVRPPPESTVDAPRDTVATGWPMPLIEKIQTALAAIKKKESESLRRQLNELVCGGDRKPSITGDEEITVVSDSLSSLAVARTRRVSTSDRYLDRRRDEREEEEEGPESEYEDGEGRVIRRERGKKKRRKEEEERSRSSPDSLLPLARPTAASAAKTRTASPRREEEKRQRKDELRRAKRLLESDTSHLQTEHRESLRTLLDLGSPPPIQFKHSVTVASVARNLAELARVAPPSITDLLVQRRTSAKPSSSSSQKRGGARVVKAIRPQRPTSGGAGGGSRKSGGATMEEEERNSNVLLVEGTKKSSVVDAAEDSENNVEWRREKRMGGVFLREEGGALTRATAGAAAAAHPGEEQSAAEAAAAAAAELHAQHCERCGLHKSWLALFLFGSVVHRVAVVVREGAYGKGGVPSSLEEWCDALNRVVARKEEKRPACAKCERAMQKALESVRATGRFCDGLRPTGTRVDAEAMREKVLSLPEEVLRAAVFGVRTERRRGRRSGEERREEREEERLEKENGVQHLPTAAVPPAVNGDGKEEKENGNGEEREVEGEEEEEGKKWTTMMDAREVLTGALFALGREGLREMITQRVSRQTLECLSDADWALLARLLAPRENAGTAVPVQMARTMLKEYGMHKFVSIEAPPTPAPPSTVSTPPSIRGGGGYGRRVPPSVDSPPAREPATVSWPMDTAGVCPMCSLSLSAAAGGGRATSSAAAAEGPGDQVACYPCGHAYHAVCMGEATRRRQNGAQPGISPVCIVCRVRARRSKAAAAAGK